MKRKTLQLKRALRSVLLVLLLSSVGMTKMKAENITFADANVKAICVANWDTNGNGELSYAEAAAVTDLGQVFRENTTITSFEELQYFTGLTSLGQYAFGWCMSLISIVIPNSVTTIDAAFYDCRSLVSIVIPQSVTTISSSAFSGCDVLEQIIVELGNPVYDSRDNCNAIIKTQSNELIQGCKSTVIPNTVTAIGWNAFSLIGGLTSITIPESVTSISYTSFYACSGLEEIIVNPNNPVYDSRGNCNAIIETDSNKLIAGSRNTHIPNSITIIGTYAFSYRYDEGGDYSIIIPNSVNVLESRAFLGCRSMVSIEIPSFVTNIGAYCFDECWSLASMMVLASEPPVLGEHVFNEVSRNIPVYVPFGTVETYQSAGGWNEFTNIQEYGPCPISFADTNVKALCVTNWDTNGDGELSYAEAATVSDLGEVFKHNYDIISFDELQFFTGLTSVGDYAFAWCHNLHSIVIPNFVTAINGHAFFDCRSLSSITIPKSVTSIMYENEAFIHCDNLSQIIVKEGNLVYDSRGNCNAIIETNSNKLIVGCMNTTFPSTVTTIVGNAFRGSNLTSISIPNTIVSIQGNPFTSCYNLNEIIVEPGNEAYDSRNNCNAIIETSTNKLVSGCKNTIIPNVVMSVGSGAFMWCWYLTSVVLPQSVTTIGDHAFFDCRHLTSITILSEVPPTLGYDAFGYVPKNIPVYVPFGTVNAYQVAPGWNEFTNYHELAYIISSGYGSSEGHWRFIASPLVEDTAPTTVDNMITEALYDLYRFDQTENAEWRNYKANNFNLVNGQGYLYANAEDVNLIFKGGFNEDDTKEVGLAYDANAEFAGWNLVGNPFPVNAYANKSYYTMNEEGTAIEPNMVSSATAIPTCTGVMVMAEAEGETVVFSTEAPEAATNQGCLQIELSQAVELVETPTRKQDGPSTGSGTLHDKAIVSFNAGDRLEKFVFNKENAVISISQGGKELAIACSDKQGEIPLNFKATKNGEYTLTINPEAVELDYLHLIDNLTGADVDLLALRQAQGPANYTFEAKTTDYASRFRLVFSGKEADVPSTGSETFAFVNNGNIIITGADAGATLQIVDMQGRIIVCCDAAHHVSIDGMTSGEYVLRLIEGESIRTQKIVIE